MRRHKSKLKLIDLTPFNAMYRRAYSEEKVLPGRGITIYTGKPNQYAIDQILDDLKRSSYIIRIIETPKPIPHKVTWWDDPAYPPAEQYLTGVIKL